MTTVTVSCGQCGAPIGMPEGVQFATCAHCGSRLALRQGEGVWYTEVLERVAATVTRVDEKLETVQLQNDLERLDREWQMEREAYLVRDEHGRTSEPSVVGTVLALAVGLAIFAMFFSFAPIRGFGGLPVVMLVLFVVGGIVAILGLGRYSARKDAYLDRREKLVDRLDGVEEGPGGGTDLPGSDGSSGVPTGSPFGRF